jgi:hypothetical protein
MITPENIRKASSSIVMLGNFNPAIFSPAWLYNENIISSEGLETSIRYYISLDNFQIESGLEPFMEICSITNSIFANRLSHTPVSAIGLNFSFDLKMDLERRMRLGRALAPTAPWLRFGKRIEDAHSDSLGGLADLVMQETFGQSALPKRSRTGFRRVQVRPVIDFSSNLFVSVHVNDHFDMPNEKASAAARLATEEFDKSHSEAREILNDIWQIANAGS